MPMNVMAKLQVAAAILPLIEKLIDIFKNIFDGNSSATNNWNRSEKDKAAVEQALKEFDAQFKQVAENYSRWTPGQGNLCYTGKMDSIGDVRAGLQALDKFRDDAARKGYNTESIDRAISTLREIETKMKEFKWDDNNVDDVKFNVPKLVPAPPGGAVLVGGTYPSADPNSVS
jgi:hypothetical protein